MGHMSTVQELGFCPTSTGERISQCVIDSLAKNHIDRQNIILCRQSVAVELSFVPSGGRIFKPINEKPITLAGGETILVFHFLPSMIPPKDGVHSKPLLALLEDFPKAIETLQVLYKSDEFVYGLTNPRFAQFAHKYLDMHIAPINANLTFMQKKKGNFQESQAVLSTLNHVAEYLKATERERLRYINRLKRDQSPLWREELLRQMQGN